MMHSDQDFFKLLKYPPYL
jgi:hypothetical protein